MYEYIERKAIRDALYDADAITMSGVKILNQFPVADVAPVQHGRWIDKGEYAVCTECGGRSSTQYDSVEPIPLMTQFCPNCGAKMDGELNE